MLDHGRAMSGMSNERFKIDRQEDQAEGFGKHDWSRSDGAEDQRDHRSRRGRVGNESPAWMVGHRGTEEGEAGQDASGCSCDEP